MSLESKFPTSNTKVEDGNIESHRELTLHHLAEGGQLATDMFVKSLLLVTRMLITPSRYGNSLVSVDSEVEAKLRRKIDLHIIPIVSLLYLFCFIDRANIGK